MMLANLYRKAGQERSAVTSYKEVLRQCPLALDAIIGMHGHRDTFIQQITFNLLLYVHTNTCLPRTVPGLSEPLCSNVLFWPHDRSVCEKYFLNQVRLFFSSRSSLFISQRSWSGIHDYGCDPEHPQPGLALCLDQSLCLHTCRRQSKSHQHYMVSRALMFYIKWLNIVFLLMWQSCPFDYISVPPSSCFSSLEKKSLLRDNVDLLVSLADVYFRAGDTKNAILKFEQAQMLDPYLIKGVLQFYLCNDWPCTWSVLWHCIYQFTIKTHLRAILSFKGGTGDNYGDSRSTVDAL